MSARSLHGKVEKDSRLTLGEGSRNAIGDSQAGGTTANDDKVILVPELGDLPRGKPVGVAGESLDDAQDAGADREGVEETHVLLFGEMWTRVWVVFEKNEYPTGEQMGVATLEKEKLREEEEE